MALQVPGICGWSGEPAATGAEPRQWLAGMRQAQPWPDDGRPLPGACCDADGACLAAGGALLADASLRAAIVGRHYWRDPQLEQRRLADGAAAALAQAWHGHGEALLPLLGGEFVLALQDRASATTLLATDRMARYPLFWSQRPGLLAFGGSVDAVAALPGIRCEPSPQGLYHYVFFHMVPAPGTFFTDIHKLRAGECLKYVDGRCTVSCYWVPEFDEHDVADGDETGAGLLAAIDTAVQRHGVGNGAGTGATGAFLSGGLDSSTVAGVLARHIERPPVFSIGFAADGYDEIAYARIARDHFGLDGHEYYVTPDDIVTALPQIAAAYDEPFGNSSALPAYFCARMAREHGIQRLLAGDGGDELFAGNERYVKQQVFESYQRVPRWLRQGMIEPLLRCLSERLPLIAKARSYVRQANVPLPERLHQYNFLVQLAATDIFDAEVLREVDTELPFRQQRAVYERPVGATRLNRMLYLDWQYTLADNDLRKVNRMCQLAGVEVAYPLLDDLVVDYSLRVPSRRKIDRGRLRHFYKAAMREFLPAQILDKSKHGFGLPFGVWTRQHDGLKTLVAETLERLRQRGYFRDDFLDRARQLHRTGHAAYFGELIWILMMFELWSGARGKR